MRVLLFDPYSGASGDMIMGCMIDLGADSTAVRDTVESVGCKLEIFRESRGHISALRAKVLSDRRYHGVDEAKSILQSSILKDNALQMALKALDVLAGAESTVHGLPREEAKFHEIGALDALADIAGSCAALQSLKAERILSLPISVGGGFFSSQHGLLPVPGPAALEILRAGNIPWKGGPVDQELLTPTGAALIAAMVDRFVLEYPLIQAEKVGYGAGSRDGTMPNALRAVIGETRHENLAPDRVVQLETNVDDVTGEVLGSLIEMLIDAGALDVSLIPAIMKKGRSGCVIRAIARNDDIERLSRLIMVETGSLGIRIFPSIHRCIAEREKIEIAVAINGVSYRSSAKVSRLGGGILNIKPEYEDCKKIAEETKLPLRTIIKKVEEEGWRSFGS